MVKRTRPDQTSTITTTTDRLRASRTVRRTAVLGNAGAVLERMVYNERGNVQVLDGAWGVIRFTDEPNKGADQNLANYFDAPPSNFLAGGKRLRRRCV
jgi:hypothetical protein